MCQPTVVLFVALLCSSVLLQETNAQNACETECVRNIYANNCGQASCITGVSSSEQFNSLCGPACISAISGGGMLDCLTYIGGSIDVQNSFVLTVQNFCAQGDPFAPLPVVPAESPAEPVSTDADDLGPAEAPATSEASDMEESSDLNEAPASVPSAEGLEETSSEEADAPDTQPETSESPEADSVDDTDAGEDQQAEQDLEPEPEPAADPPAEPDTLLAEGPEAFPSEIGYDYDLGFDMDEAIVSIFESGFEDGSDESSFADAYDVNTI